MCGQWRNWAEGEHGVRHDDASDGSSAKRPVIHQTTLDLRSEQTECSPTKRYKQELAAMVEE